MSGAMMPPDRVPTLTEVVSWPQAPASALPLPSESQLPLPSVEADVVTLPPQVLRIADEEMVQGVLVEVQRQIELMLDYRLREALTPLLARAADGIVRDARAELASTLRDVVARAVAEELARHRTR